MFWNFNFGSFFSSFNSYVRNLIETIKARNDDGQPEQAASPMRSMEVVGTTS